MLISTAHAQDAAAVAGPTSLFASPLFMMLIFFAVFYFLILRPQNKRYKEHLALVNGVSKGSKVVTDSGIYGEIVELVDEDKVVLEVADGTRMLMVRNSVANVVEEKLHKVAPKTSSPKKGK